jgi:hypothetical protein
VKRCLLHPAKTAMPKLVSPLACFLGQGVPASPSNPCFMIQGPAAAATAGSAVGDVPGGAAAQDEMPCLTAALSIGGAAQQLEAQRRHPQTLPPLPQRIVPCRSCWYSSLHALPAKHSSCRGPYPKHLCNLQRCAGPLPSRTSRDTACSSSAGFDECVEMRLVSLTDMRIPESHRVY